MMCAQYRVALHKHGPEIVICTHMYVCNFLSHTHSHTHTLTHTHKLSLTHTITYIHTYTHTHTCIHAHTRTYTHAHLFDVWLAQDLLALHKRGAEMVSVTILTGKDSQTQVRCTANPNPIPTRDILYL